MTSRALITGGAGFIGSHVADLFLDRGYEVEIIDDISTGRRENVPERAKLYELSVTSPEAASVVRTGKFDVLVHLAAQMDVRRSVEDPLYDATTNILGIINILEAVMASGRGTRVVFTSTGGAVYGDFNTPPNIETYPKEPDSPYAISKLASEYYLAYYGRLHGLEHVSVRLGNVYGPRQDPRGEAGVVAIFCSRLLEGKALTIFGNGEQTRDYVYVGDVAAAVWRGATFNPPPAGAVDARSFNIGTGVGTSVIELARILQQSARTSVDLVFAPKRPGELEHSFLDIEKARDVLGWKPEVSLADGLARTFAWAEAEYSAQRS
jgi:UDP-glucose 4-epimerase